MEVNVVSDVSGTISNAYVSTTSHVSVDISALVDILHQFWDIFAKFWKDVIIYRCAVPQGSNGVNNSTSWSKDASRSFRTYPQVAIKIDNLAISDNIHNIHNFHNIHNTKASAHIPR